MFLLCLQLTNSIRISVTPMDILRAFTVKTLCVYFGSVGPSLESYITLMRLLAFRYFNFASLWASFPPKPKTITRDDGIYQQFGDILLPITRVQRIRDPTFRLRLLNYPVTFAVHNWNLMAFSPVIWAAILDHVAKTQLHLQTSVDWCRSMTYEPKDFYDLFSLEGWKLIDGHCLDLILSQQPNPFVRLPSQFGRTLGDAQALLRVAHLAYFASKFHNGIQLANAAVQVLQSQMGSLTLNLLFWANRFSPEGSVEKAFIFLTQTYDNPYMYKSIQEEAMFRFELAQVAAIRNLDLGLVRKYSLGLFKKYPPGVVSPYHAKELLYFLGIEFLHTRNGWHQDWQELPLTYDSPYWPQKFLPPSELVLKWRRNHVILPSRHIPQEEIVMLKELSGLLIPKKLPVRGLVRILETSEVNHQIDAIRQYAEAILNMGIVKIIEEQLYFNCAQIDLLEQAIFYVGARIALLAIEGTPLPRLSKQIRRERIEYKEFCFTDVVVKEIFQALIGELRRIIKTWALPYSLIT